jgi:ribosomal protein S27AE
VGLIVNARCARCGFSREGLRLGATMEQMSGERRSALHLYACVSCRDVAQIEVFLGEELGETRCDRCREPIALTRAFVVTRLKGNKLEGHDCPRCGESALAFVEGGRFL